jgi:hypothetical protein
MKPMKRRNSNVCIHYVLGVALGQPGEPTAIGVIEQETHKAESWGTRNHELRLRHLERLPLSAGYVETAETARKIVEALRDEEQASQSAVIIDLTGTGRAALQLFKDAGLRPYGVTVTGGTDEVEEQSPYLWRVPRTVLIGGLQVHFQAQRLKVAAELEHAETFKTELQTLKLRPPSLNQNDPEAWRERPNDDLVYAVALAGWRCERHKPNPKSVNDAWAKGSDEVSKRYAAAMNPGCQRE